MDGDGTSQAVLGRVYYPDVFVFKCKLTIPVENGTTEIFLEKQVAAFGGPIFMATQDGYARNQTGRIDFIPSPHTIDWLPYGAHKLGSTNYVQFFGRTPPDTEAELPTHYGPWEQEPSNCWASIPPQLGDYILTWSPPSFIKVIPVTGFHPVHVVRLFGTDSGEEAPVSVQMQVVWTTNDAPPQTFSGSTMDNTGNYPPGEWNSNKITSRVPDHLTLVRSVLNHHPLPIADMWQSAPWQWPSNGPQYQHLTRSSAKRHDTLRLVDSLGDKMPGVLVQERFSVAPPGGIVNDASRFWRTLFEPFSSVPVTTKAQAWPDFNVARSYKVSDGDFSDFDHLHWIWDVTNNSTYNFGHMFVGGTTNPLFQTNGVDVGYWNIQLIPAGPLVAGTVNHSP